MRWSKKNAIHYTTSRFYLIRRKSFFFYQINYFTNIFHEHFSRTFFTNIFHEHFSRIFFKNIFYEYFSRTFFTNIFCEHFIFMFNFLILIILYKANVENLRMKHFIKINLNFILNAIIRNNRRSTFEKRILWYKKNV